MKNIIIYSMDNCPYCDAAKALLKNLQLNFQEINISNDDQKRSDLVNKTGHRTLPQIFIDDEFIGGYNELKIFLNNK